MFRKIIITAILTFTPHLSAAQNTIIEVLPPAILDVLTGTHGQCAITIKHDDSIKIRQPDKCHQFLIKMKDAMKQEGERFTEEIKSIDEFINLHILNANNYNGLGEIT
ncbi:hypothetical protein AB4254_13655 [Vibrio breoganii]